MSTEFINDQWRLPNNENKDKQSNYSMDFDATNQSVIVSSNNVFNFGTGDFTLSAWIKVDSFGSSYYPYILDFRSSGTANENAVAIYLDPNGILQVWISNSLKIGSSGTALVANTWYNVILKRENGTLSTHINGGSADQTASYAGDMNTTPPLTIGARAGNTQAINGQIDGVSIFDYALSSSQITTLYGSSSTGIGNPMSLSPKPVAYYPLGDQDAFNGASYLTPNASLKDFVFDFIPNDYISIDTNGSFPFGLMDTGVSSTVSLWANFNTLAQGSNVVLFEQRFATSRYVIWFEDATNTINFYANALKQSQAVNANQWYNIVATLDGTNARFYVDGSEVGTALTYTPVNTNQILELGRQPSNSQYFNGKLSNVQILNTALPATGSNSVETLYNNGSPLTSMSGFTSLQGWWKLDASDTYDGTNWTIEDHAGTNDGTSSGMTQANLVQSDLSFTSGYSPYALEFDGTNDYIDCGTGSRFYINQITISAWVNLSSGLTNTQIIAGIRNNTLGGGSICYQLQNQASGKFRFVIFQSNGTYVDSVANDVHQYNTWYHVLGVADGSNIKLYVNGNLQTIVSSYDGTIYSPNENFNIGRQSSPSNYYWTGKLSNVSVFNTGLTSAQVSEIYSEGIPQNLLNHSAVSSLVSWWQLGSNSSFNTNWTVLDEKGSNNGTSSNMGEDAIVDGVGSYANGLSSGMGGDEVIGDAPYSTANSLSVNMDVEDRVEDTPS